MPTSSSAHKGPNGTAQTARPAAARAALLPPTARRPGQARHSGPHGSPPRGTTPTDLLPVRRDSSIGATSSNPRLRSGSVIEAAAAHRSSSAPRPPAGARSAESKAAMRTLRHLFLPVVLRRVLRRRRRRHWRDGEPPRQYTSQSVVAAIASSKTMLAEWPLPVLEQLADEAAFHCLGPREFVVYAQESHVSCGIVVLLHGQLEERRPDKGGRRDSKAPLSSSSAIGNGNAAGSSSRPIHTQTHRLHKATDVLCVMPVLCEDRATSSLVTRDKEEADVAVISSRWFWEVYYTVAQSSLPGYDGLSRCMREVVAPHRRDIVMADYFPTSVVMLRSWMWPLLTASDRVKLCRAMEVRVLGVGERLFSEGDDCPYIYFVRRGALTVVVKGEALAVLEAGACVGEESVLFHEKRNSTVVGSTICELYALHVRHLEHRLTKYPEVGQRIIGAAVERQRRWMEQGKTRDVFGLVSILSGIPCLGHSTETMREELARCAVVSNLPQGHVLATANTPCTGLFVIGRGTVALSTTVRPTAPATPSTAESPRLGSAAGRSGAPAAPPPKRRPSSTSTAGNPRASIISATPLNVQEVAAPPEVRRELRSAGDFFGELCLKPHLWPCDVVCESTVSVWYFDREAILQVLEKSRADAQAIEVCRQGISLYRAQRGEGSLIEGFDAPVTPNDVSGRRASSTRRGSRAPSSNPTTRRRSSVVVTEPLRMSLSQGPAKEESGSAVPPPIPDVTTRLVRGANAAAAMVKLDWSTEQWTAYALARLQAGLAEERGDGQPASAALPARELRAVDKEVEKAMKEKVLRLIAVQSSTPPNPADCDISGEGEELQAIIVEQLFLIPTEQQPRFVRQVNDSNVRLVTESEEAPAVAAATSTPLLEEDALRDPWQSGEAPISVGGVMRLEDVTAAEEDALQTRPFASYTFQGVSDAADPGAVIRTLGETMELSGQVPLPPGLGRSRRSMSAAALEDSAVGFMAALGPRNSFSRSHFVRPPSGLPISPRSNVRNELISPRGTSAMRPGSASEPRIAPPTRTRPASVDYNQYNKVGGDRSASVLDRYVKIEDQNYFDSYVKVLPLQQDEIWAPDELSADEAEMSLGSMVLLLLHVRQCDFLAPEVMRRCQRPVVKVTLGQRVLVRTPVMADTTHPQWPMAASSFITFVRRGMEIVFAVCDADDEANVLYTATLRTASIHENGGVGQLVMSLQATSSAASANGESSSGSPSAQKEEGAAEKPAGDEPEGNAAARKAEQQPHMTTTMLAVTASKYKALRQALKTREEKQKEKEVSTTAAAVDGEPASASSASASTLYVQVMAVEGLKHRIEASVTVSFYNGGTLRQLLETNRVLPKTRSPAWPADRAFVKLCADGGVLTFDLQHKGAVISSAEVTVDELVFGGVGLRRLPLLQAQTGSAAMAQLVLCVLGASAPGALESRSREWVTHVAVEELRLSADRFAITPDPFVVLRDGAGAVRLRTPLVCGALEATWAMAEASCVLPCPRLSGSTTTYQLEVCDSDAAEVVARASVVVEAESGVLGGGRREIPLTPAGSGVVRLRSLRLPVMELPQLQGPLLTGAKSTVAPPALTEDATVLLLHVSGCDGLPDGATNEFQTDAIGTLSVDRRRLLRTPLREGTTRPRWPFARSTVALRIPPADLRRLHCRTDADAALCALYGSHECRFSVYDGVVDEVSRIGQVAVPLEQLLTSATHVFPLFPRGSGAAGGPSSSMSEQQRTTDDGTLTVAVVPPGRTVGQVRVVTLLSRLSGEAENADEPDSALTHADTRVYEPSCAAPVPPSPELTVLPYYNPDSPAVTAAAAAAAQSASASVRGATVLLSASNVCHVLPNASAKTIHLVVRQGPVPVLSLECQMGVSSHAEWSPAESSAAIALASLADGDEEGSSTAALSVELHAMDIVEGKGEAEEGEAASAPTLDNVTSALRQQTSVPVERVLLGKGKLPAAVLTAVGVGEVAVVTVVLEGSTGGAPVGGEGAPAVSFCVIGSRL